MPSSNPDFDKIIQAYRDRYGVDLSHMRMKWSKHPVYNDGRRSYDLDDDEVGGSWVNDGTVRINPKMGPVMKRFGIEGMTQAEFRRRLIAHELAHEVWHNQSREAKVRRLISDSLAKAREENFTTPYLDTYPADTPKKKFDSELFAEYMSDQLNKKAESAEEMAAELKRRLKYGLRYSDGTYETSPDMWDRRDARDIVVQTPEELGESGIGMCHDVTQALLRRLRENRIRGTAVMLKGNHEPNLPTHSFVVTKKDGKYTVLDPLSYDSGHKGGYGSMDDAISGRIEDWKKEDEKGDVVSSRIRSRDWKKLGLLDFLRYRHEKKAQAVTPEEIEAMARPHYADSGSHGWNHIRDVLASARRMRRKELLKKELAALMYHDSSLLTGPRETHAEDSADIARKELAGKFSRRQLADIANAIAHHRASYEGKRKSRLEDLVAAADRDVFVDGNIDNYVLRSYRYGLEHGMTPDEAVDNTLHHMPDKYGTNGYAYANVPKIYMDAYGDEVRKAQKAFDSLTADRIREISKKASDAKYSLKEDPTYEDALKVFGKLDFDDRANLVPRHPDFLRKVPDDMLFDRQVVVDGKGDPVGFQEFYSRRDRRGRRLPPHNIIAVAPEARGNGLARIMAEAAIRKARKEKVRRLLWEAFADNEPSIRAALSAGFEDATPKSAKGYRKFVYNVPEKAAR